MQLVHSYTAICPTSDAANAALESNLGLIRKAVASVDVPADLREDAFQEAAISFLENYDRWDQSRARLSTFMWPHLRGAVTHMLRSERRAPECTGDDDELDGLQSVTLRDLDPTWTTAVEAEDHAWLRTEVSRFMDGLDPVDRRVATDLFWGEQSTAEVARTTGVSRQSIHVRKNRICDLGRGFFAPVPTSLSA